MPLELESKKTREVRMLMDSIMEAKGDGADLQLDAVTEIGDKLSAADNGLGLSHIHKAIFDSVESYQRQHGVKPSASLVEVALDHANVMMDDVLAEAGATASNSRALQPELAMVAIRAMIQSGTPFAHYISTNVTTGEAPLIIVSHNANADFGMYAKGDSLNGLNGGNPYITSDRIAKLTSSDKTVFNGKITSVMTSFLEGKSDGKVAPLYKNRTQIWVNGLVCATSHGVSDSETASGVAVIGKEPFTFTATVNTTAGEVNVTFAKAVPENTDVSARGFINTEETTEHPIIIAGAQKFTMYAHSYKALTTVTPEADVQFKKEIGIDPRFEGTMAIRAQFANEQLFKKLAEACLIAKYQTAYTYEFPISTAKLEKTQAEVALDIITEIAKADQEMLNANGSHGVSHIYVDDTMRAIFLAMHPAYFERAEIAPRTGAYRLGRLAGRYEVYYTPKGLVKSDVTNASRMLLIGANAAQPMFNPFIFGEASAPKITEAQATVGTSNSGYWVTGKAFAEQNPVAQYASSVRTIDVIFKAL